MAAPQCHLDMERLLTPAEVAELFKVHPLTVTRWANQGRIGSVRTLGGVNNALTYMSAHDQSAGAAAAD